ncbi:MAG: sensor histidine kinase [Planctomyces sp.]
MSNAKFTVDTHLFRELGELLVGRNSTALVELIKNAYDADATIVTVHGRNLDDPRKGSITITDDGIGMNKERFERGFLTIASRFKESSNRKSAKFKRRFTGAKGIGRLAAHKLATFLQVESIPDPNFVEPSDHILDASIDWAKIEQKRLFDDIESSGAIQVDTSPRPRKAKPGTTITLQRLRKKWTPAELVQLQAEVESFQPPDILVNLPKGLVPGERLFDRPKIADIDTTDTGIRCELTGDFATGEGYWPQLATGSHWLIEIDASSSRRKVQIRIAPTKTGKAEIEEARVCDFKYEHPDHDAGPHFVARILVREGNLGDRTFKQWMSRSYGVRVYNEGFRVLPYGEPNNDWLLLDADYKTRPRALSWLDQKGFEEPTDDKDEGLTFLGNSSYFGAVFLTSAGAPNLRMLVNREGFSSDASFDHMFDIVRTAIYLSVRVRAAAKLQPRIARRDERQQKAKPRVELRTAVEQSVTEATNLAKEARREAAQGNINEAQRLIEKASSKFTEGAETHDRLMTEGAILRVLASVGTQMAAFVHEIKGILGMAQALESAVSEIEAGISLPAASKKRLSQLRTSIRDLKRGIERQASYLTDVISPDARRRRSRQKLAERFDAACRLISATASRKGIEIENDIPNELKSVPMFPAELIVVFSNLLTNAVKAADHEGRVRAVAKIDREGQVVVTVENTGVAVEPNEGERWFQPFESTTVETDPVLGQGMGMGLPITRNLLEDYGAAIRFAAPSRGFSTALQITFPK